MYRGHKLCKFPANSRGTSTPPLDKTADSQTSCSVGIISIWPVHLQAHIMATPLQPCVKLQLLSTLTVFIFFHIFLTVHLRIILVGNQLDAQFLL